MSLRSISVSRLSLVAACLALSPFSSDAEVRAALPKVALEALPHGEFGEPEVARAQSLLLKSETEADGLEQLCWAFINKARHHDQASCYARALACAVALESRHPDRKTDSLLIKGHVRHQQHQFDQALNMATRLVATRGNAFDHGLLGDVLLDLGKVDSAGEAYQRMLDLRPGLSSYLRAAEMRWITGDAEGALEAGLLALKAGTIRQPGPLAWAYSRMAYVLWAQGRLAESEAAADRALVLLPRFGPALVAKSRSLFAAGDVVAATETLKQISAEDWEPLTLWLARECHEALGNDVQAQALGKRILTRGIQVDPRTVSLYLSTINRNGAVALQLAESEFEKRQDIHTQDAVAFALLRRSQALQESAPVEAANLLKRARKSIERALVHGTLDARLWLHAGLIFRASGDTALANAHFDRARDRQHMLYPSERRLLADAHDSSRSPALSNIDEEQRPFRGASSSPKS